MITIKLTNLEARRIIQALEDRITLTKTAREWLPPEKGKALKEDAGFLKQIADKIRDAIV